MSPSLLQYFHWQCGEEQVKKEKKVYTGQKLHINSVLWQSHRYSQILIPDPQQKSWAQASEKGKTAMWEELCSASRAPLPPCLCLQGRGQGGHRSPRMSETYLAAYIPNITSLPPPTMPVCLPILHHHSHPHLQQRPELQNHF